MPHLVLHYIEDIEPLLKVIHRALVACERLVFSVEHPIITCRPRGRGKLPQPGWIVDNYFITGRRVTSWLGGQVVKYHRTVENYFACLQGTGFVVESIREAEPQREWIEDADTYRLRQQIPFFLMMAANKTAGQERS